MVKSTKEGAEHEESLGGEGGGQESRLYELGYHLLPTVAEEMLGGEVSKIKDIVETGGGIVVSHEMPRPFILAYPISKIIQGKRTHYTSAYFGSMKFQALSQKVPVLFKELEKNPEVLRFIIFKTTEAKMARLPKQMKFFRAPNFSGKKESAPKDAEKALSEAELEKTVEELISE